MSEQPMNTEAAKPPSGLPRWFVFLPVATLAVIAGFFAYGLTRDPHELPSLMIDRPMPAFALDPIDSETPLLTTEDLQGEVSLINVFGSWCVACAAEHPMLMDIGESGLVRLHGVDWRDPPGVGASWLREYGNPYDHIGVDSDSRLAVELGVTGAPETFLVDRTGTVRYKHIGPITPEFWRETLLPLIRELERSS